MAKVETIFRNTWKLDPAILLYGARGYTTGVDFGVECLYASRNDRAPAVFFRFLLPEGHFNIQETFGLFPRQVFFFKRPDRRY